MMKSQKSVFGRINDIIDKKRDFPSNVLVQLNKFIHKIFLEITCHHEILIYDAVFVDMNNYINCIFQNR